jgi:hypothetical protein
MMSRRKKAGGELSALTDVKGNGVNTPWLSCSFNPMLVVRVKNLCDECSKLSLFPDNLMKLILQSSCHQQLAKRRHRQCENDVICNIVLEPRQATCANCLLRDVLIAMCMVFQAAAICRKEANFIPDSPAAPSIYNASESFLTGWLFRRKQTSHRYIYCWVILVRN